MTLSIFVPIRKVDAAQRLVYGVATAEVADKSGEIMDYASTVPYYKEWSGDFEKTTAGKSLGNVRAMHGSVAAGKVTEIVYNDELKQIEICAKIVDDAEWKKVEEGVYTGFSQGGDYIKRWEDPTDSKLKRYTAKPCEVSIVDNPCVPTATFEYVKSDGAVEMRKFKETAVEEPIKKDGEVEQGWRAKDGSFHKSKADALKKNSEVDAETLAAPAAEALKAAEEALSRVEGEQAPTEVVVEQPAGPSDEELAAQAAAAKEAEKAALKGVLQKDIGELSRAAELIDGLVWLHESLADGVLAKAMASQIADDLRALVIEETAELTAEKATEAKFAQSQVDTLRKVTSNPDLIAGFTGAQPEPDDTLEKVTSENDALKKVVGDLSGRIGDLAKKIENLEAQPAPAKGVKVVLKGHEGSNSGTPNPVEAYLSSTGRAMSPEGMREEVLGWAKSQSEPA